MGLWGAAQAIAFGLGGILGTAAVDIATLLFGSAVWAYAAVFGTEALLFSVATAFAIRLSQRDFERGARGRSISGGEMLASDARGALR
jgi:BCD family chlorophyll transporter-like MFS transporter